MAVKIRLARHGATKRPFYRIVVADSQCKRDGRFLENVGTYNPLTDPVQVTIKAERVQYWLQQGAIPTDTVKTLLKKEGVTAQPAQQASQRTLLDQRPRQGRWAMKDLIKYIAQALVDFPDQVSVTEVVGNQTSVLELKVAKEDLGKIIGKQGRTARAMRTILSAASAKIKKRTVLEIIE